MGNVERVVVDQREAERRDLICRRKTDQGFKFRFTGAGDVTGASSTLEVFTKQGGTSLLSKAGTLADVAGPNPSASFTITAAELQALVNDDPADTVVYYFEVTMTLPTPTVWAIGDLVVNP